MISDIIDAADSQNIMLLGLLDMSVAFDTIDHKIILRRVEESFGVRGQALQWLSSFLTDRTQVVAFAGSISTDVAVWRPTGIRIGSFVSLLFFLYTADVLKIAAKHGVCSHAFADDLQTHASYAATDQQTATTRLLACVLNMSPNRLKLNADKAEFIWLGRRQKLAMINVTPLHIGGQTINPVDKVRDLGVTIGDELTMDTLLTLIPSAPIWKSQKIEI